MNIVQLQEQLKNFSQDQLVREMQMPSGTAPQFLVLGEIMRRQKMQQDFANRQAQGAPQSTVAEDAIASAGVPQGGIADMARALAPQTDMTKNTGVQAMAAGGPVKKMAAGDKIVRGGKILVEQEDGTYRDENGRVVRSAVEDIAAIPSDLATAMDIRSGEQERTWGQRNIGDPLRSLFQPVGEAGRAIGQPVGEALRSVGEPVGAAARDVGAAVMADAPRFILGPIPAEAPAPAAPEYSPELARPGRFEPAGDGLGLNMLPPEVDPEYFARRAIEARPISEILTPEPLSREEAQAEIEAMAARDAELAAQQDALPMSTGTPLTADAARTAAAQAAEIVQAQPTAPVAPAGIAAVAPASAGGTGAGGTGAGGAGGAGGMSSYEQELMDVLGRREKAAEQDKWLALAQVGLNLMSSTQPTLMGALGEAGLKGVEAARSARDQYDKDRIELLGALEQSRLARAAAAAKAARGAASGGLGGLGISAGTGRLLTQINSDIERLSNVVNDPYLRGAIASGEATPEEEMSYAQAQRRLQETIATREAILYGGAAVSQEDDELSADLSD